MIAVNKNSDSLDFSTVLASSVHDMKNSLSMLLCTLDDIATTCAPNGCASALKFSQLQFEGQRVNNNLIQLLAIYRIENSHYSAKIREHSVADFLQESVLQFQPILTPKGISIEFQCDPDLMAFFDREMVAGVVNNVVNNAYRYAKDRILLSASRHNQYVTISVRDNGAGYPEKMLCNHSTSLSELNFSSGSTGLGLYFSALVAKMHTNKNTSGYINFTNDGIDNGGCFSIFLP